MPHARTYSQWSHDAHATICARTSKPPPIGHVMRTSTRARTHALTHIHRSRYAPARTHHSPPAAHARITHTPSRAHTQANAQEHELSQSSVIRCTLVHAHALPRACALNGPEAYFYYY